MITGLRKNNRINDIVVRFSEKNPTAVFFSRTKENRLKRVVNDGVVENGFVIFMNGSYMGPAVAVMLAVL